MTDHILVVDDEPDLQRFIELVFKRKIRKKIFQFSFASNGKEALKQLDSNPDINLVLTDLNMPEMDGFTLLQEIKERGSCIKPVVLSAYGDFSSIRKAMNHGAFDFLTKPINLNDLEITVNKTLEEISYLKQAESDRKNIIAIERELDIAHQLQKSMMPSFPRRIGPYLLDGQVSPSSKVGGDFWDLIDLADDASLLVIGDSSGHGLSSALVMAAIRHSLQALATQISSYKDMVDPLNDLIYREFKARGYYATMFFVYLEKSSRRVSYLRAGHELLMHRRKGAFQKEDWRGGFPVGLFPKRSLDEWVELELEDGDEIYIYTDGIVDGLPNNEPGIEHLLNEITDLPQKLCNQSFFRYLASHYGWKNTDDASLILLRLEDNA